MLYGIGVDLCDINRIKKALVQKGFKERVFSEEEIMYAESKAIPARHYAAAFAAKEAVAKATGWGIAGIGLNSLFVRRTDNGPELVFNDDLSKKMKNAKIYNAFLSISHDGDMAIAMVVLEKEIG
ncbi:MAG: holo-ACP synthase [Synergistaceae bacterium]|nr:holo-ACP synthase [Synergistaceae bacterium]